MIFTSQNEGFGKAPVEALFQGLYIICNKDVDLSKELTKYNIPVWRSVDLFNRSNNNINNLKSIIEKLSYESLENIMEPIEDIKNLDIKEIATKYLTLIKKF